MQVEAISGRNGFQYRCVITDNDGVSVTSNAATLTVLKQLAITTQPKSVTVVNGGTASTSVVATGEGLTYTWYYTDNEKDTTFSQVTSIKTGTYSIKMTPDRDGRKVYCVIKDKYGNSKQTNTVTLSMSGTAKIGTQPKSATAVAGTNVTFTVGATGDGLTYQWQYKDPAVGKWYNSGLTGNKTPNFQVGATTGRNNFQYRCKVTDAYGNVVYSDAATLTVTKALSVTTQPKSITATKGTTVTFTVKASGEGLTYQWQYKDPAVGKWYNSGLTGNKTTNFQVGATTGRNNFQYRCKITDAYGNVVYSNAATLTVK